jgi:uncharacterized delta-60 repeat protein
MTHRRRRSPASLNVLETLEVRAVLAVGDLEPTFGGVETVIESPVLESTRGNSLLALPGGKTLVAADATSRFKQRVVLSRFNSDGSADLSFGVEGTVDLQDGSRPRLAQDSSGAVLVVFRAPNGGLRTLKVSVDGVVDSTFAGDGLAELSETDFGINGVRVDSSDRLTVLAGNTLYRVLSNGTLDSTLAGSGTLSIVPGTPGENVSGFFLDTSGRIVVTSYEELRGVVETMTLRARRYSETGVLDTSFGSQGTSETQVTGGFDFQSAGEPSRNANDSYVLPITVGGGVMVARIQPGGQLDTSYGDAGTRVVGFGGAVFNARVRTLSDGRVVAGVAFSTSIANSGAPNWAFFRVSANGALDATFGNGGIATVNSTLNGVLGDFLAEDSGRILGGGYASPSQNTLALVNQLMLASITPQGTLNPAFDNDGVLLTQAILVGPAVVFPGAAAIQKDGKLVIGGWTTRPDFVVLRRNADGSVDTSFGTNGVVKVRLPVSEDLSATRVHGAAIDSAGRIVVVGHNGSGPSARAYVLRLLANGSRDAAFGANGLVRLEALKSGEGLVVQADDRIVVGGVGQSPVDSRGDLVLLRLNQAGVLDTSFGQSGIATVPKTILVRSFALAQGSDGKLVVAANDHSLTGVPPVVVRWFANGSLDASFGNGGVKTFAPKSTSNPYLPTTVLVSLDGRITVGSRVGESESAEAVRFLADGSLDESFGAPETPGYARFPSPDPSGLVQFADGEYAFATGDALFGPHSDVSVFRYDDRGGRLPGESFLDPFMNRPHLKASPAGNLLIPLQNGNVILFGTRTDVGAPTALQFFQYGLLPGIEAPPRGTLTTTESGGTASFDVRLSSKPDADVTVSVASSDPTEGTVNVNSVTFTPDNWSTPQVVTIIGVDDTLFDADQRYRIVLGDSVSTDARFNGKSLKPIEVRNRDDETLRVFRTFNPRANFHFFTTSVAEFQAVQPNGYSDEATGRGGFSLAATQPAGFAPLFRLYNLQQGYHYYTASAGERDFLLALNPPETDPNFGRVGWRFEGSPGFITDTQQPGTTEIFRLYNRTSGAHLFTENPAVRQVILALPGWEEHTRLGFAFLVNDEAPPAPVPPPPAIPATASATTSVSNVDDATESASVASLIAVPAGTRSSLPTASAAVSDGSSSTIAPAVSPESIPADLLDSCLQSFDWDLVDTTV